MQALRVGMIAQITGISEKLIFPDIFFFKFSGNSGNFKLRNSYLKTSCKSDISMQLHTTNMTSMRMHRFQLCSTFCI